MVAALARRLGHLDHIGPGYLSLDRPSATLSGGEWQRVKLVRHLGSSLTGMTCIFDEPSIGCTRTTRTLDVVARADWTSTRARAPIAVASSSRGRRRSSSSLRCR